MASSGHDMSVEMTAARNMYLGSHRDSEQPRGGARPTQIIGPTSVLLEDGSFGRLELVWDKAQPKGGSSDLRWVVTDWVFVASVSAAWGVACGPVELQSGLIRFLRSVELHNMYCTNCLKNSKLWDGDPCEGERPMDHMVCRLRATV